MSAHQTGNTTPFIHAQQYSDFILANLPDVLLPSGFYRDVSDFGSGTTLNIKSVGSATIQDVTEGVPMTFNAIDTGNVTLTISNYKGDAWSISDELKQDGTQLEALMAMRAMEATRALGEEHETAFLKACNDGQTNANANNVNGVAHRIVSAETNNVAALSHFIDMKLAFDKANAPQAGRVAIVDPVVEATLNSMTNIVNVSNNPMFEGIVTEGFARNHKFVRNIFGWDIYTSNLLDQPVSIGDGTTTIASSGGVANVFMCVADDNCRPMMNAWRKQPSVEGWREPKAREDQYQTTARYGIGAQRLDTLGILGTSKTSY